MHKPFSSWIHWRLDDTDTQMALDSGTNGLDARFVGGTETGAAPAISEGHSVRLDGSDGHVWIGPGDGPSAQTLASTEELTIELWFKTADAPMDGHLQHLARWRWYGWGLYVLDGRIYAEVWEDPNGGTDSGA